MKLRRVAKYMNSPRLHPRSGPNFFKKHDLAHVSPFEVGDPPPEWMASEAKAVWFRCATTLLAVGVLNPMDKFFFAIFCATYAQMQHSRRMMATPATETVQAEAERYIGDFGIHLNDMLLQMGFYSESDFEKFLREAIQ